MPELPNTSFNSDVIAEFRANGGRVEGLWPYQTQTTRTLPLFELKRF